MIRVIMNFVMVVLLAACTPKPPIPPVPPSPDADAGTDIDDSVRATCSNLCKHLKAMRCLAGEPTAGGALCSEVCTNIQTSDVLVMDLNCRIQAKTCADVDVCK